MPPPSDPTPLDAPIDDPTIRPAYADQVEGGLKVYQLVWCILVLWQGWYFARVWVQFNDFRMGFLALVVAFLVFQLLLLQLQLWLYWRDWRAESVAARKHGAITLPPFGPNDHKAQRAAQKNVGWHLVIAIFIAYKNLYLNAGHWGTVVLMGLLTLCSFLGWWYVHKIGDLKKHHMT